MLEPGDVDSDVSGSPLCSPTTPVSQCRDQDACRTTPKKHAPSKHNNAINRSFLVSTLATRTHWLEIVPPRPCCIQHQKPDGTASQKERHPHKLTQDIQHLQVVSMFRTESDDFPVERSSSRCARNRFTIQPERWRPLSWNVKFVGVCETTPPSPAELDATYHIAHITPIMFLPAASRTHSERAAKLLAGPSEPSGREGIGLKELQHLLGDLVAS